MDTNIGVVPDVPDRKHNLFRRLCNNQTHYSTGLIGEEELIDIGTDISKVISYIYVDHDGKRLWSVFQCPW